LWSFLKCKWPSTWSHTLQTAQILPRSELCECHISDLCPMCIPRALTINVVVPGHRHSCAIHALKQTDPMHIAPCSDYALLLSHALLMCSHSAVIALRSCNKIARSVSFLGCKHQSVDQLAMNCFSSHLSRQELGLCCSCANRPCWPLSCTPPSAAHCLLLNMEITVNFSAPFERAYTEGLLPWGQ
jgi:hypothetical protein